MNFQEIFLQTKTIFANKLSDKYGKEIIGDEDVFNELGVDSLLLMEIIIDLEDIFNITFDDEKLTLDNLRTINNICKLILIS